MKLSNGEKLILLALADASDEEGGRSIDLKFIRNAILSGHTWALDWEGPSISSEDTPSEIADETADILSMWSVIERAVAALSPEDREKLEADASPFDLEFTGFDGNHDKHFGVASFMVEDMRRFTEFSERNLNSHSSTNLDHYRRMIPRYKDVMKARGFRPLDLSADELLSIIKNDWTDRDSN